jgi:hypothetical protein
MYGDYAAGFLQFQLDQFTDKIREKWVYQYYTNHHHFNPY